MMLNEYLADDFLRLKALTKRYFAVSIYVSSGVVLLFVFLLCVLIFATSTKLDRNITAGKSVTE
jgi:uncharacterized membrane protein